MKAIASSLLVFAAALFWQASVNLPDSSGIKYFGILLAIVITWMGLAGFWRSWSPEEK
jgi:hypothetical protein